MLDLTALIAYKDRDFNLSCCLASINACKPRPHVIVVDFGSRKSIVKYMKQYPLWLSVVRVTKNTGFFHKARALNIGLKRIRTTFLCATDSDQLFQPNFFNVVYKTIKSNKICVLCRTHFLTALPKNTSPIYIANNYFGLLQRAKKGGRKVRGDGCCTGLPTSWTRRVHGWDEEYIGYGAEDSDLIIRARRSGFAPRVINSMTSMLHIPHSKKTDYYSGKYLDNNRKRYKKQKQLMKCGNKHKIVVNTGSSWGIL